MHSQILRSRCVSTPFPPPAVAFVCIGINARVVRAGDGDTRGGLVGMYDFGVRTWMDICETDQRDTGRCISQLLFQCCF
jgi:hypothetical protein